MWLHTSKNLFVDLLFLPLLPALMHQSHVGGKKAANQIAGRIMRSEIAVGAKKSIHVKHAHILV